VMLLRREGIRLPILKREGFQIIDAAIPRFRPRHNPRAWLALPVALMRGASALRKFRPDIVHAWLFWAHLWAWLLHLVAGGRSRLITSRRQLSIFKQDVAWMNAVENTINRRCAAIICNSKAVLDDTRRNERNTRGRLAMIYGGIDLAPWRDATPAKLAETFPELRRAESVTICVASYIANKGHADLVAAWTAVTAAIPGARLLCVGGDGGELENLRRQARELRVEKSIVFSDARMDVPSLVRAADVCVLASHEEGFSNVILEGMLCGKPVVATDVGGNGEAIVDGVTGLLVPARDPEALAMALIDVLCDGRLRRDFGAAGAARVAKLFPLERMIAKHESLYRRILAKRRTS
jgi:glycosyltransferase involved in cell wall biosynthesis